MQLVEIYIETNTKIINFFFFVKLSWFMYIYNWKKNNWEKSVLANIFDLSAYERRLDHFLLYLRKCQKNDFHFVKRNEENRVATIRTRTIGKAVAGTKMSEGAFNSDQPLL